MVVFAVPPWKLQQETAKKRSLYVMACTRVAAEGGKKVLYFRLQLLPLFFFSDSSHTSLRRILPLPYLNPSGIHRGDQEDLPCSFICIWQVCCWELPGPFLASSVSGKWYGHMVTTVELVLSLPISMELNIL